MFRFLIFTLFILSGCEVPDAPSLPDVNAFYFSYEEMLQQQKELENQVACIANE